MSSLNKVLIMGRLGQDPELRYTANRTAVATLNIATTESWSRDGERQENTEWHRVVVWSRQAENCSKYLAKGRPVFIEGRLQTRSWEDKTGAKRFTTEIIANNVQFLPAAGAPASNNQYAGESQGSSSQYGQNTSNQGSNMGMSGDQFPQADPLPSNPMEAANGQATDHLADIPF